MILNDTTTTKMNEMAASTSNDSSSPRFKKSKRSSSSTSISRIKGWVYRRSSNKKNAECSSSTGNIDSILVVEQPKTSRIESSPTSFSPSTNAVPCHGNDDALTSKQLQQNEEESNIQNNNSTTTTSDYNHIMNTTNIVSGKNNRSCSKTTIQKQNDYDTSCNENSPSQSIDSSCSGSSKSRNSNNSSNSHYRYGNKPRKSFPESTAIHCRDNDNNNDIEDSKPSVLTTSAMALSTSTDNGITLPPVFLENDRIASPVDNTHSHFDGKDECNQIFVQQQQIQEWKEQLQNQQTVLRQFQQQNETLLKYIEQQQQLLQRNERKKINTTTISADPSACRNFVSSPQSQIPLRQSSTTEVNCNASAHRVSLDSKCRTSSTTGTAIIPNLHHSFSSTRDESNAYLIKPNLSQNSLETVDPTNPINCIKSKKRPLFQLDENNDDNLSVVQSADQQHPLHSKFKVAKHATVVISTSETSNLIQSKGISNADKSTAITDNQKENIWTKTPATAMAINKSDKNKASKQEKSIDSGWVSNRTARSFINMKQQQQPSSDTIRSTLPPPPQGTSSPLQQIVTRSINKSSRRSLPSKKNEYDNVSSHNRNIIMHNDDHQYVYREVVRNKKIRQQLNCYDCVQCRKFYAALNRSAGQDDVTSTANTNHINNNDDVPFCHPIATIENNHNHTTTGNNTSFGRHRARYAPTETPIDFWELDFIDERSS